VTRRLRLQSAIADAYQAVFEDWAVSCSASLAAYVMLALTAGAAPSHPRLALFLVGAVVLLLLFIGTYNAWGTATYRVLVKRQEQGKLSASAEEPETN